MKKTLLLFFSSLLLAAAFAQPALKYAFTHYGQSQGLASNEAVCTVQDDEGFMWMGTSNGLQRYDGVRYLTFKHQKDNPSSIPGNYIQQLHIDKKGNLWLVADGNRVGIFDTRWFTFKEVDIRLEHPSYQRSLKKIVEDEQGNMMMVIGSVQLLTYDQKSNEFSAAHNFITIQKEWGIVDIYQLPGTEKYVIGTHQGIMLYNNRTKEINRAGHNPDNEQIVQHFGQLKSAVHFMTDSSGRLWFDIWEDFPRIYMYDIRKNEIVLAKYDFLAAIGGYHEVHGFLQQMNGSIWINGLGVFARYLEKEKKFQMVFNGYENEQSIAYAKVNHLAEDREGNLWVATSNNGLYRFNPAEQFFTNIRHIQRQTGKPGDGSVMSFAYTKSGTILAGTWGDGLYRYDSNLNLLPLNIKGFSEKGTPSIWGMCLSADSNTIWMASQPGIHKYDQAAGKVTFYSPPAMKNRTVRQVAEDRLGNLWLGTQSIGLFKWDKEKGKTKFDEGISFIKELPEAQVSRIYIDNSGNVWVAIDGWGLYVIDPVTDKVVKHFGSKEPEGRKLPDDIVRGILQYNDSLVLLLSNGIHIYHNRQQRIIASVGSAEATFGPAVSIEKDRFGYVWLSGVSGIYRVNIFSRIFIGFSRVDGIANDYFIISSSLTLPDGRMLFGADNQFVAFDPSKVQINDMAPPVVLTGFSLMNKALLVDSLRQLNRVELAPDDNAIAIQFSGLSYNSAYIIRYKMEGLDKDWKIADKNFEAIYSYLPPGNYVFKLRSEDAEGKPGPHITELKIKVRPPFWKTWWFLGLVIFAATAVLFWLDKLRMQKLRATESIRTRIATSLTDDLSNSLSSINISSELAKTKVDSDTQRTKEYIGQISETSNRMVQAMYDMVWSIDPGNDTMSDTIDRMKSYAMETENTNAITIDFDIDPRVEQLKLDMEHRYELLCIFKEALNNAAKHSDCRNVKVSLRLNRQLLMMLIVDDGKGFVMSDAAMLSRGMSDMRRRAAILNARLYVESEINTGTVVKLETPV